MPNTQPPTTNRASHHTKQAATPDATQHDDTTARDALACDAIGLCTVAGNDGFELFNTIQEETDGTVPVPMLSVATPAGRMPAICAPAIDTEVTALTERLTALLQTALPPILENLALPALWQFTLPPEFCLRAEFINAECIKTLLCETFPEIATWLDAGELTLRFSWQTDGAMQQLQQAVKCYKEPEKNAKSSYQSLIFGGLDSLLNMGTALQIQGINHLRMRAQDHDKIALGEAAAFVRFRHIDANTPALANLIGIATKCDKQELEWPKQITPWVQQAFASQTRSPTINTMLWNTTSVADTQKYWQTMELDTINCQQLTTAVTVGEVGAATLALQLAASASALSQAENTTTHLLIETANYPHYGMVAIQSPALSAYVAPDAPAKAA